MDQGWAAVLAAAVGLVGALVGSLTGAYAAIRGAREGADRAARAAMEQAAQQAQDQHVHWLLQERRMAYTDMLQDVESSLMSLAELVNCAEHQSDAEENRIAALGALEATLTGQVQLIRRLAPLATVATREVLYGFQQYVAEHGELHRTVLGLRPPNLPFHEIRRYFEAVSRLHASLTVLVAKDIQRGPASKTDDA